MNTSKPMTQGVAEERPWFLSLSDLKQAHSDLLRKQRQGSVQDQFDEIEDLIQRGRATGALLVTESDRESAQSLLDYWATVFCRAGQEMPDTSLAEYDPTLAPDLPDDRCPYPGINRMREGQVDTFFGRRGLIEAGLEHLKSDRMVVYVGATGSGKSSLVRFGLIAALKAGALPGSRDWRYPPPITPGAGPLDSLARLVPASGPEEFRRSPGHLARLLDESGETPAVVVVDRFEELFLLSRNASDHRMFVENLLGLIRSKKQPHVLVLGMKQEDVEHIGQMPSLRPLFERAQVQMTPPNASELRDAIEKPAGFVGLRFGDGVVNGLVQDVLGEPQALSLLQFSLLGLWDRREGNLIPRAAYRKVGGGRRSIVLAADEFYHGLDASDRVEARRILLRLVRPEHILPESQSGTPGSVTGSVSRQSLLETGDDPGRAARILDDLVEARLVRRREGNRPDEDRYELVHEAIVRNWPPMIDWLSDKQIALAGLRRLDLRASEWVRLGRVGGLLDPVELRESERTLESPEASEFGVGPAVQDFLQASRSSIEAAEQAREDARRRELEQARALAEEQTRRADLEARASRIHQALAYALAVALLGVLVLAVVAWNQKKLAQELEKLAESRQYAAQSESMLIDQLDKALLKSLDAYDETHHTVEATSSLLTGLQFSPRLLRYLQTPKQALGIGASSVAVDKIAPRSFCIASSIDGKTLATGYPDGSIHLSFVDGNPEEDPVSFLIREGPAVTGLAFCPDGRLVSGHSNGMIRLWPLVPDEKPHGGVLRATVIQSPSRESDPTILSVAAATYGSDGATLMASGGADGRVRLWRISQNKVALIGEKVAGHNKKAVRCVAFSRDGRTLASGGEDSTVVLWNLDPPSESGAGEGPSLPNEGIRLIGHRESLLGVAFSPNGQILATCGKDNAVILWSLAGPAPQKLAPPMIVHTDDVTGVAFSPDGGTLASAGADEVVILWEVPARSPIDFAPVLHGHTESVSGVVFCGHDGHTLASVGIDSAVLLWDVQDAEHVPPLGEVRVTRSNAVRAVAFLDQRQTLAAAGDSGDIVFWDVNKRTRIPQPHIGHARPVGCLAYNAKAKLLASGAEDGSLSLWDVSDPSHPRLIGCSIDCDMSKRTQPFKIPLPEGTTGKPLPVSGLAFNPEGTVLAASFGDYENRSTDTSVLLWSIDRKTGVQALPSLHRKGWHTIWGVAFSPDGQLLACAADDGYVYLSEWKDDAKPAWSDPARLGLEGEGHTLGVHSVAFNFRGDTLASGGWDSTVRLWDVRQRKAKDQPVLAGHLGDVRSVTFTKDGLLASGSIDETVILWDVDRARPEMIGTPLVGHTDGIRSLSYDHEANILASGSWDGSVILWDLPEPGDSERKIEPIGDPLYDEADQLDSLAVSPDGKWLATNDIAKTINIYENVKKSSLHEREPVSAKGESELRPMMLDAAVGRIHGLAFNRPVTGVRSSEASGPLLLAAGGLDGRIHLWRLENEELHPLAPLMPPEGRLRRYVNALEFSTNGWKLASVASDGRVVVWDTRLKSSPGLVLEPIKVQNNPPQSNPRNEVFGLAFSRDSHFVAAGMADGTVSVWQSAADGKHFLAPEPLPPPHPRMAVRGLAFSRDGTDTILVAGGDDGYVYGWRRHLSGEWETLFKDHEPLKGHKDEIFSVAISPDGKILATGGGDRTIRLWDLATGQALGRPLLHHRTDVMKVVFENESSLFSLGSDGTIVRWDVGVKRWKARIRNLVPQLPTRGKLSRSLASEAR